MAGSLKTMLAFIAVLVISTAIVSCQEGLNDSLIEDSTVNDSFTFPTRFPTRFSSGQNFRPASASPALEVPLDKPECEYAYEKCAFQVYDDQFTRRHLGDPMFYCKCSAGFRCIFDRDILRGRFYEYRCSNGTVEESVTDRPMPRCYGGTHNYCGFRHYRSSTKNVYLENFFCECAEGLQCRWDEDESINYYAHRCQDVPDPVFEQEEATTPLPIQEQEEAETTPLPIQEQEEAATTPLPIQRRKGEL